MDRIATVVTRERVIKLCDRDGSDFLSVDIDTVHTRHGHLLVVKVTLLAARLERGMIRVSHLVVGISFSDRQIVAVETEMRFHFPGEAKEKEIQTHLSVTEVSLGGRWGEGGREGCTSTEDR
jgi:hypothetical protein